MACDECQACGEPTKPGAAQKVAIVCDLTDGLGCEHRASLVYDANCQPIWAVLRVCAGTPDGGTSYFDLDGVAVDPPMPLRTDCGDFSFQQIVFCDSGNNNHPFISRVAFDAEGNLIPGVTGQFELDGVTPYELVGEPFVCADGNQVVVEQGCIYNVELDQPVAEVEIVKGVSPATGEILYLRIYSLDGGTEHVLPLGVGLELRQSCGPKQSSKSAHRVVLTGVDSWVAPPGAQSVTFTVASQSSTVTVTTDDGDSMMFPGESATWSVTKEKDSDLDGGLLMVETGVSDILIINWIG